MAKNKHLSVERQVWRYLFILFEIKKYQHNQACCKPERNCNHKKYIDGTFYDAIRVTELCILGADDPYLSGCFQQAQAVCQGSGQKSKVPDQTKQGQL